MPKRSVDFSDPEASTGMLAAREQLLKDLLAEAIQSRDNLEIWNKNQKLEAKARTNGFIDSGRAVALERNISLATLESKSRQQLQGQHRACKQQTHHERNDSRPAEILFPLTMAPPANSDYFLYPHLDPINKFSSQQRPRIICQQPGAANRRTTPVEEHHEMLAALRDALANGFVRLTKVCENQEHL